MAAAALEQSVLESKDKDTLLEMAKALGVKATARLKKSEIIDKILDTTSSAAPNGAEAAAPVADEPVSPSPASSNGGESPSAPVGPDGEPLADWELELASSGPEATEATDAVATDKASTDKASTDTASADAVDRHGRRRRHLGWLRRRAAGRGPPAGRQPPAGRRPPAG